MPQELSSIQQKPRGSSTPHHIELSRSLDCCSPLQLSAPQPAVEQTAGSPTPATPAVWQQAACTKAAAGCRSPRVWPFRVVVGSDGALISLCWTFPDGRDSIRSNLSGHIAGRLPTGCLFCSVETAYCVVSRRDDCSPNRWPPRDILVDEPPSDF